jgi:hypothetical protein
MFTRIVRDAVLISSLTLDINCVVQSVSNTLVYLAATCLVSSDTLPSSHTVSKREGGPFQRPFTVDRPDIHFPTCYTIHSTAVSSTYL